MNTPEDKVRGLVQEHFHILERDLEIKSDLMKVLVKEQMIDFFSINWRRLDRQFNTNTHRKKVDEYA